MYVTFPSQMDFCNHPITFSATFLALQVTFPFSEQQVADRRRLTPFAFFFPVISKISENNQYYVGGRELLNEATKIVDFLAHQNKVRAICVHQA